MGSFIAHLKPPFIAEIDYEYETQKCGYNFNKFMPFTSYT